MQIFLIKISELGSFGDFISAILSGVVLYYLRQEYLSNKLAKHKESIYQLEKDLLDVEERLLRQTSQKSFSSLLTRLLLEESLIKYLDNFPDLRRYAMLYEELLSRTDSGKMDNELSRFNQTIRENLIARITQNEKELLKRLSDYCPNAVLFLFP